ncbi:MULTISPECIES: exodeoxyribonuclease VII small subunit [unclassified Nitrospina]|uniref:exodeoxyribonuclease VII small subunit n=1 Tax=unclassified Nitrospina TaxID=2638683 RepID=UPI003F9C7805
MAEMKFEKALQRLEQIVAELEKGELDIDKSLQIFEEGIKMSRICSKKLQEAEQKIEKLTRNQKGELVAELFGGDTALADDEEDDDDEEDE